MKNCKPDKDKNQAALPGFEGGYQKAVSEVYKEFKKADQAMREAIQSAPDRPDIEDEYELGQEIAMALKQDLREKGMDRAVFCDEVNLYLGRTEERYKEKECRKLLTKGILDKMISNPTDYPIDTYYLFAFQHVLGESGIIRTILAAKGASVMSKEDKNLLSYVRLQELKGHIMTLEKDWKKGVL